MKQKKKIVYSCIALLLACACFIAAPNVSAKYVLDSTGTAWQLIFSAFEIVTDAFVINNENGQTSEKLWGAMADDGSTSYKEDYTLGKLSNVEFSVLNNTDKQMLITFEMTVCIADYKVISWFGDTDLGNSAHYMDFVIKNTSLTENNSLEGEFVKKGAAGHDNSLANVELEKDESEKAYSNTIIIVKYDYYYYNGVANPQNILIADAEKAILSEAFVIDPGETFSYNMSTTYRSPTGSDSVASTYASIKMIAVPYTPAS